MSEYRLMVVANRTCPCPGLASDVARLLEGRLGAVLVVAPALNSRLRHWTSDVDRAVREAGARLDTAVALLRTEGIAARGEVGDADPVQAIGDSMAMFDAHAVLISTWPEGRSHWLERDLPAACATPLRRPGRARRLALRADRRAAHRELSVRRWAALLVPTLLGVLAGGCGTTAQRQDGAGAAQEQRGHVLFARQLEGPVVPGPVLARDGSVLAASNAGVLHALDPVSGRDRWRFRGDDGSYGIDLSTSPLVGREGRILWPGPGDRLYALDGSGRRLWSRAFASMPLTPAAGPGSVVYVMESGGVLHALSVSARGSRLRWSLRVGSGASYGSPAVGEDGRVYTTVGRELVAVDDRGTTARIAWRFGAAADVEVSPAVAPDGTVVLGTNDRFEYGVSPAGRERWRVRRDVYTYSSPLTTPDGLVRYGDHRGRLFTVKASTGRVLRIDQAHGQIWTRPAVDARGNVVVGTHPGEIFAFSATGRQVLHVKTGGSVESYPVSGPDGTTYLGSEDGRLYAVRPGAP